MEKAKKEKDKEQHSKISTVSNFITTFIVAVIAIVAVAFLVIKIAGLQVYTIESASMLPSYPVNSIVLVKEVDPEKIEVDDVITYVLNEDGVLVTHRVVEVDSESRYFTTKGDANTNNDALPVYWDNVVGKVVFDVPFLGYPVKILTNTDNLPWIIAVIAAIGIVCVSLDLWEKKKKKQKAESPESNADTLSNDRENQQSRTDVIENKAQKNTAVSPFEDAVNRRSKTDSAENDKPKCTAVSPFEDAENRHD